MIIVLLLMSLLMFAAVSWLFAFALGLTLIKGMALALGLGLIAGSRK
jgi:hypothetical protein